MNNWLNRFGKALDWPSALSKRGKVSDPFGDYDGDGVPNMNDCKPKDPKKQDIQGPVAMGAAGQAQMAMTQQRIVQKEPTETIVIATVSPRKQIRPTKTKIVTQLRGPMTQGLDEEI